MAASSHRSLSSRILFQTAVLLLILLGLGIIGWMVWNEVVEVLKLCLSGVLQVLWLALCGYLASILGATAIGGMVVLVQHQIESRRRARHLVEFITHVAVDGQGTSLEREPLYQPARRAMCRVLAERSETDPNQQATALDLTDCTSLRTDSAVRQLYLSSREAYLEGSNAMLCKCVSDALSLTRFNPWYLAQWILYLPIYPFRGRGHFSHKYPLFNDRKLKTNLEDWYRVTDLFLLPNIGIMKEVAHRLPVLVEAKTTPSSPQLKSPEETTVIQGQLDQVKREIQTLGPQWKNPHKLLRHAKQVALEYQVRAPGVAEKFLAEIRHYEDRLDQFPAEVFQELVDSEIEASRWPQWFTRGIETSQSRYGVEVTSEQHKQACIYGFVMGSDAPDGIAPAQVAQVKPTAPPQTFTSEAGGLRIVEEEDLSEGSADEPSVEGLF